MKNGDSLRNDDNQSGGLIILPFLDGRNKYYLFNSAGLGYGDYLYDGYTYNIINMDAAGGLGIVEQKDIRLGSHNSSEKLTIVKHRNGVDAWLVTRDPSNSFYTYKITCEGVDTVPVISIIGINTILDSIANAYTNGAIKASPDGKLIAAAYNYGYSPHALELYRFDNVTGRLSNLISIDSIVNPFGIEFTSDSRLLYASDLIISANSSKIYQIDVSNYDAAAINNSKIIVSDKDALASGEHGYIQLGPDNKMYVANASRYSLDVINKPDVYGPGCNYVVDQVNLAGKQIGRTLPFAPTFLFLQPNVQISYNVANDCRTVVLTGKTYIKGSNLSFKWLFGDGDSTLQNIPATPDTTSASITHFFPPGKDTFFVRLMVTSDTVCGVGNATKAVIVKPPRPTANFGAVINCNNLQVQFTDSSLLNFNFLTGHAPLQHIVQFTDSSLLNFNPSISYTWLFGDGQTSHLQTPLASYINFNDYPVTLMVKSPLSCVAGDTLTRRIQLLPKPTGAFNITNANCINQPKNFTSTATAADSIILYKWLFNSTDSASGKTARFIYPEGGAKTVKHYVLSAKGCAGDTTQQTFFIESTPHADFSYTDACIKQPVYFTNKSTNVFGAVNNYTWQFEDNKTSHFTNASNEYSSFGSYTVQLTASTAKGCADSISKTLNIINSKANAGNDTAVFAGSPFTLKGSGGNNYVWQPAFLLNNNQIANPVGKLQSDQQLILTVSNSQQCKSSDSVYVKIIKPIAIPNAFTPNGDRLNDTWVIGNLSDYKNARLTIYNRYGRVVFKSNNYQNNWEGKLNGKLLEAGVYVYLLQIENPDHKLPVYKGTFILIR